MRSVLISVETLPDEGSDVPLLFSAEDANGFLGAAGVEDVRVVADLAGEARAFPSGRDVFVLGRIHSRVSYRCVRCLETFDEDVAGEFHRVYTTAPDAQSGEAELRREDLEVEPIVGGAIDLSRAAAEELSLALKPYPVCRDSCQGLCPGCGGNRNRGECRCEGAAKDPRFAALETLRGRIKEGG